MLACDFQTKQPAVRTGKPTRTPSRTPAQETVPLCRHGPAIQCLTLLLWKSGFCKSTNFSLQIRHAFFLHFPHFFSPRICYFQKKMYLCSLFRGVLAQLARAFDWQSRGQGFDSPILHSSKMTALKEKLEKVCRYKKKAVHLQPQLRASTARKLP